LLFFASAEIWIKASPSSQNNKEEGFRMSRLFSIFMIGLGGYFAYQNRYRLINVLFGNAFLRRFLVSSVMSFPGIRDRMMSSVFSSGASEGRQ
jgi:hypothetical protein